MTKVEYRVRPVTRYIVTRWEGEEGRNGPASRVVSSEYDNERTAYEVAYALCRVEHERLGYPPGDMRIIYPDPIVGPSGLQDSPGTPLGAVLGAAADALFSGPILRGASDQFPLENHPSSPLG